MLADVDICLSASILARGVAIPASSALTRERFGWLPAHPGLIDDLDAGHYFHDGSA
jgi:hypothetical protein